MKRIFVIFTFVFILFCSPTVGDVHITEVSVHPDHPGKCWSKELNVSVAVDETIHLPNQCTTSYCLSNYSFRILGCGTVGFPSHCEYVPYDLSKTHPECCPSFICKDLEDDDI